MIKFGLEGCGDGQFSGPYGIVVDDKYNGSQLPQDTNLDPKGKFPQ